MKFGSQVKLHNDSGGPVRPVFNPSLIWKVCAVVVLVVVALVLLLFSPLFSVDDVKIEGLDRFDNAEIQEYLSEYKDENGFSLILKYNSLLDFNKIFSGRLYELEKTLKFDFPYLKNARVSYKFPNGLNVEVSERNAVLFVKEFDDNICIDNEGYVVKVMNDEELSDFRNTDVTGGTSVVKGLNIGQYMLGKKLVEDDKKTIYNTVRLCSAINENPSLCGKIDVVDVSVEGDVYLIAEPSLTVSFGGFDDMYTKVLRLAAIFEKGYDGNADGTIDFTTGGYDVFLPNKEVDQSNGSEG
jgi:cell division protein FtsQ